MITFLIESKDGLPLHDFGFTVIDAINQLKWYWRESCNYEFVRVNSTYFGRDDISSGSNWVKLMGDGKHIPIGSIEFVGEFIKKFYGKELPKPLNIPEKLGVPPHLQIHTKRNCGIFEHSLERLQYLWKDQMPFFVKSNTQIKKFAMVVYDEHDLYSIPPDESYFLSSYIEIISEWRTFVFHDKIVGLSHYDGDCLLIPDVVEIQKMVDTYKEDENRPVAYTLDVGVNKNVNQGTFIIEVHDFFSVGLYGFPQLDILLKMYQEGFKRLIK